MGDRQGLGDLFANAVPAPGDDAHRFVRHQLQSGEEQIPQDRSNEVLTTFLDYGGRARARSLAEGGGRMAGRARRPAARDN